MKQLNTRKMSRYIFTAALFLAFSFSINAQEFKGEQFSPDASKVEVFIKEVSNAEQFDRMEAEEIAFLKNAFQNRVIITKLENTPSNFVELEDIAYNNELAEADHFNPEDLNPFYYKVDFYNKKQDLYYKVYDTGYYMLIKKRG